MLRAAVVEQIRPETIRWSSKLKELSCNEKNGEDEKSKKKHSKKAVTVTLTDGTTIDAALLVGADGIFSMVRQQLSLPGDRLYYVGFIVVLGIVPTPWDELGEEAEALILAKRRIFETVDGVTRFYAMPFTKNVTMWQLTFPYEERAARSMVKDTAAVKAEVLRRCGGWHEPIPALLNATTLDNMSGYPVLDRDPLDPNVLRTSEEQRRVTLIGDAAHPMSPFKAQGANQALHDAVLLADILEESVRKHGPATGLDIALPVFERRMLQRSARMVLGSREKAKELHSSLAMQPARKVQRESGVDMPEIIRVLRERGIGTHSATDPKGLDAIVGEVMDSFGSGDSSVARQSEDKKRKTADRHDQNEEPVEKPRQKRQKKEETVADFARTGDLASRLESWRRVLDDELIAAGGQLQWKKLRKAMVSCYKKKKAVLNGKGHKGNEISDEELGFQALSCIPDAYLSKEDSVVTLPS
eukprot:TRINITY_DN17777_c0_g1_i6.p1 TRINITY_DN17777_c0_g1~~TRINITY_DN17777_c0_g1_i6.p1  ORF type:complete len:471 (-),score=110.97 TRINITY_DN17777_c0_g1_i6:527-1939(-)